MNEQVTKLITDLSTKLGVATEVLWRVLVKQAFIDGIISIIQIVVLVIAVYYNVKFFKFMAKKSEEKREELYYIPSIITSVILAIIIIIVFFSLSDLASAFFNPEYWALNKLLLYLPK